jgi:hypothetical protein
MKSSLSARCLVVSIAVAASSSSAHAQGTAAKNPWLIGLEVGQAAVTADAFYDIPWKVSDKGYSERQGHVPGEYAFSVYAGRFFTKYAHLDAVLTGRLDGTLGSQSDNAFGVGIVGPFREYTYQGRSRGELFATSYARVVFEPGREQALVRPRAQMAAGIILGKWAAAALVGAGVAIGSAKTRLTLDAGEQFYRIAYRLRERHYTGNNNPFEENITTGMQNPQGYFVHIGVEHVLQHQ